MDTQSVRDRIVAQGVRHTDTYAMHYEIYGSKAAEHLLQTLNQDRLEIYQEVLKLEELVKLSASE